MSWDVMVLNYHGASPKDITLSSDEDGPDVLGPAESVRQAITNALPGVDWSDPTWGVYMGDGFTFEFNTGKDDRRCTYEEVAARIGEHGNDGIQFLMDQANNVQGDEPRLGAVLLGLALSHLDDPSDDPWVERFLLAHLEDRRPSIVAGAIDDLTALCALAAHDQMLALARHRPPYVRGAVLRYLAKLFPDGAGPLLLTGLRDRHFAVRESAVDALDETEALDAAQALEAIQPLLDDPHPDVRQAAETAVHNLSDDVRG